MQILPLCYLHLVAASRSYFDGALHQNEGLLENSLLLNSLTFPIVQGHTLCLHLRAARVPKHYITLHYITLHYITLHYITLHYITLQYITLHYITLHYITLHYITLHYIILLYITMVFCNLHCIYMYIWVCGCGCGVGGTSRYLFTPIKLLPKTIEHSIHAWLTALLIMVLEILHHSSSNQQP